MSEHTTVFARYLLVEPVTLDWGIDVIDCGFTEYAPVVARIDAETPPAVIDELSEKFPAFRQAWVGNGLQEEEFEDFGPVQFFRNAFINGCYQLLAAVVSRRHALAL